MKKSKTYNLNELYDNETSLQKYRRLTVGEKSSLIDLLFNELVLTLCVGRFGMLGIGLRRLIYPLIYKNISKRSTFGRNVMLRCPKQITINNNVIIDDSVQLIATSKNQQAIAIGEGSFVRSFAMLNAGPPEGFIKIGRNSSIGQATILYGNGGLTIGNNVMIAGQVFIVASTHLFENKNKPMSEQGYSADGIKICDNVWIGAGAKILDGITIGEGAIVGANAVVTKDIEPWEKVAGVPAMTIPS